MAITRSQMRRQLRRNGGIMNVVPRQNYGIGSWIKKRVRKIIPNELADIASKAAPFVAPFNPLAAGIMRGVGRFDKRGSISDALKQGLLTYGGGQLAQRLGTGKFQTGLETRNPFTDIMERIPKGIRETGSQVKEKFKSIIDPKLAEKLKVPGITDIAKQQLLFGTITGGLTYVYEKFMKEELPQQAGETMEEFMARRKENVGKKMRNYMDSYLAYDPKYSAMTDEEKDAFVAQYNMKKGGRVGLASGSPHSELPTFSEGVKQKYVSDEAGALPKSEGGVLSKDVGKLSIDDFDNIEDYRRYIKYLNKTKKATKKAKGGRIGKYGGGIGAAMPRISTGIPRVNAGGIRELDYRATGGYVPMGVKEKADDVPAMLSKNEFVMTADAVKGAGGGSVEKGAQRMYDTMKKLEGRVA